MAARLAAVLPRFAILTVVFLLATATLTFAAQRTVVAAPSAKTPEAAAPAVLVVPDVRGQAYVFAKGILEDGGFAWRVRGAAQGFAANLVADQVPPAGTRVLDTGAPTILLRLRRNPAYAQDGTPENAAPFFGSPVRLVAASKRRAAKKPAHATKPARPAKLARKAAVTKPTAKPKPHARPPAFVAANAPKEPGNEISLPERAQRLQAWLEQHRRPTNANVRSFLYQHAWIVTGARFGWWRGEAALRVLVRVDERAQRLWGLGAKNERVARRTLALVRARSR